MSSCSKCFDTGFIATGNNDLPCEFCFRGAEVAFNTPTGRLTGLQIHKRDHGHRPIPAAWAKAQKRTEAVCSTCGGRGLLDGNMPCPKCPQGALLSSLEVGEGDLNSLSAMSAEVLDILRNE